MVIRAKSTGTHIRTTGGVIDALGGPQVVRKLTRSSLPSISNARARGTFNPRTFLILNHALAAIGATAPSELWSIDPVRKRKKRAR